MNSSIKVFLVFSFLSIITSDSFAQSLTQIEYEEKIHCAGIPMSDLGYYYTNKLAPGYKIIQDLYFRVDDTKVDSIVVELPVFEDSLVMLRIMPIPIGIELQLYDANMKKLGSNYIAANDKYYDGLTGKTSQKYFLVLKIRKPLSEKAKGVIFRVAVGKRTYEQEKEETSKKDKKIKNKKQKK